MKKITFILAFLCSSFIFGQAVVINEVDADQTTTDTEEFLELYTSTPNTSLDGYIVVFYNGSNDTSYTTVDLNGFSTDANGYFIIGGDAVTGVDIALGADNVIQNGADAIAIYQDSAANFPNGTAVTATNLIDAIVYGTSDPDDAELLAGLNQTIQYDENLNGNKDTESLQRRPDNTFCTALPTLRDDNVCPGCAFVITDVTSTCDDETPGTDTVTIELEYVGGGSETYTIVATTGTVGGDNPSSVPNGTIIVTGVDEDSTVDITVTSTSCNVTETVATPTCEAPNSVADIATLRASTEGQSYILTGEALVTFTQDFRNQKFIEDATAAILIDDDNGIITTAYEIGDGMTGLRGTLSSFNGMMQFVPELDPGAPSSTGNTITAQSVSIADLNGNPEDYESEYVTITPEVTIDTTADPNWIVGTVYELNNADGAFNFRTTFYDANYIGQAVPTSPVIIAGIITERTDDGGYYITARDDNDASTILGVNRFETNVFSMFPNPTEGFVNIVSADASAKTVVVFDLLGKQVINTVISDRLDISALTSGMYLVKVSQGNFSETKKLIIK